MSQQNAFHSGSAPTEGLRHEMHRVVERIGRELEKLEILAAAMAAFSRPVPEYDHNFRHQRHPTASATVLHNRGR